MLSEKRKDYALIGMGALVLILLVSNLLSARRDSLKSEIHPSLVPVNVGGDKQKPEFKSPYEQNQVRNTIVKNNPTIQDCYLKHLEKKDAISSGKVQVDWQIDSSGDTLSPQIVISTLDDKEFDDCVVEKVKTFKFPPPPSDKPIYTTFTYVFRKQGESVAPQMVPFKQEPEKTQEKKKK
ncbi:energy transducer TonB [bacterium]|nr:energy transducer TonB [bacterium]